ncbi:MAG TPA: hypothetical protein VK636_00920 [Gemmatimonadaceae bacterium]|jgi:hypothetical protein|nr:hypothetical protein [Gemmatimonadaceae bacterium]
MPVWFEAGGYVMWFVLLFGLIAVIAAARFAWRPDPTQLDRIQQLSRAVAWAIVNGVASDLAAVASHIAARDDWAHSPDFALLVLQGVGESMSPAILGGGALSVVALLTAAGHARLRTQGAVP